jgi:site-specific DNA-methyltransferase (adenine-specific)
VSPEPLVEPPSEPAPRRRRTTTSNFGVSTRENHDSSPFYERFRRPELSEDTTIPPPKPIDEPFVRGDARRMHTIDDGSVALVVTSPPYFAGKQYEEELERDGIPSSYLEYLEMLTDVFAECVRKLEPGGRLAVNVANLGRKPYRSLSADVIRILQHDLGMLLRGELIWQKADGASGSCAWGSFRSAANPVLRDISERVIIASKGRFDRARTVRQRAQEGLPHESTITSDSFMAATLDVWEIPPESARRVGHPAPFPVELPEALIRLYTFKDDLVLDPFMGSGSTLVAAALLDRRYVGYDLDPAYVNTARERVSDALAIAASRPAEAERLANDGRAAQVVAEAVLVEAGFTIDRRNVRVSKTSVVLSFVALDAMGDEWWFDVAGPHADRRGGLLRMETVWRTLGRAVALRASRGATPLVALTTSMPRPQSEGDVALRAAGSDTLFDIVDVLSTAGRDRLRAYAAGAHRSAPATGFWR